MKVVIVGGGIAGLSVGLVLRTAGCDVVVLERSTPGRGATWASGGMIAATAENAGEEKPDATLARHSASLWPQFAETVEAGSGHKIAYRRDGTLIAALTQEALEALTQRQAFGTSIVSSEDARQREPLLSTAIRGALWAPEDAQVDNRALGYALALAFANAGGTLLINEPVVRFEHARGRLRGARTPFGLYEADAFVIAAGAWSGQLAGLSAEALPPVIPVKGEMVALAPPDGVTLPTRLVWGDGVYLIPRRDRLMIGATTSREGFDTSTTDAAENWLLSRARAVMPSLSGWERIEHWAGLRPGTPDDMPLIGETVVPGLFVAGGQYRNGILLAPAIAEALRCLVLERRQPPDVIPFDPKRFSGRILAVGDGVR